MISELACGSLALYSPHGGVSLKCLSVTVETEEKSNTIDTQLVLE